MTLFRSGIELDAARMKAAYEGLKAELAGSKPDTAPTR
jgi:hypothetical protein